MHGAVVAAAVVLAALPCCRCLAIQSGDILVQNLLDLQVWSTKGKLSGSLPLPFSYNYGALAAFAGYAVLLGATVDLRDHRITILQLGSSPKVRGGLCLRCNDTDIFGFGVEFGIRFPNWSFAETYTCALAGRATACRATCMTLHPLESSVRKLTPAYGRCLVRRPSPSCRAPP